MTEGVLTKNIASASENRGEECHTYPMVRRYSRGYDDWGYYIFFERWEQAEGYYTWLKDIPRVVEDGTDHSIPLVTSSMDLHLNPTWTLSRDYSAYRRARYKRHVGRIHFRYHNFQLRSIDTSFLFYSLGDMAIPRTLFE